MAFINFAYADNTNFISSSLIHVIRSNDHRPFSRNLSCQFDNVSNNKCNVAFGLFGYLVLEAFLCDLSLLIYNVFEMHKEVKPMFQGHHDAFVTNRFNTPPNLRKFHSRKQFNFI